MGKAKERSPFSQEKAKCQGGKFWWLCLSFNRNSTLSSTLLPFLGQDNSHWPLSAPKTKKTCTNTVPATDRTWKLLSCPCCSEKGKAGIQRDRPQKPGRHCLKQMPLNEVKGGCCGFQLPAYHGAEHLHLQPLDSLEWAHFQAFLTLPSNLTCSTWSIVWRDAEKQQEPLEMQFIFDYKNRAAFCTK